MSDEMNKDLELENRENLQEAVNAAEEYEVASEELFEDVVAETSPVDLQKEEKMETAILEETGSDADTQNVEEQSIYAWEDSKEAKRAEEIAKREKEKFQQRQQKEQKKAEKKAEKKAKKQSEGNGGNVFVGVAKVIGAAVLFGTVSIGVMYFLGDELDLFENENRQPAQMITNTQVGQIAEQESTSAITTEQTNNKTNVNSVTAVDVSDVVDEVMPSIVSITSKTIVQSNSMEDWFYNYYFGFGGNGNGGGDSYEEETGAGSGIIIGQNDTELLIVTNNHVVEGADSLEVQFIDGESVDAIIKGTNSSNDLAVVAIKLSDIKSETKDAIKIATLGDSDKLEVGEGAIAIGNALGYGQSVTVGVISAVERDVTIDDNTMQLIQTDAAINPGNSGGALLNMKGEVIGINAAKYSSDSVEGMGFAIPVTSVADIIEGLMNRETLTKVDEDKKGYLNIYGRDVTEDLATEFNAPKGVLIREVIKGGAAEKAGLEKLDIITAINDQTVESMDELQNMLEYYEEGKTVTLTVQYLDGKEYKEKKVDVKLGGVME